MAEAQTITAQEIWMIPKSHILILEY